MTSDAMKLFSSMACERLDWARLSLQTSVHPENVAVYIEGSRRSDPYHWERLAVGRGDTYEQATLDCLAKWLHYLGDK